MKVIDLLNKIANGEEVPIYFKVNNIKFKFEDEHQLYNDLCEDWIYLNDEVIMDEEEIIEEDKKIPEKIDQNDRVWHYLHNTKKTTEEVSDNLEHLRQKVNQIIDYLEGKE